MYVGVDGQTLNIIADPVGIPVDGQDNTFDYPILTSVTLMCIATAADGTPATATSYTWVHVECTPCFENEVTQNVTVNNLQAKDSGGVICTANVDGRDIGTTQFFLRISGRLTKTYL